MPTIFKTLNTGSISDGSYAEVDWTPDTDVTIRRMLLIERGGSALDSAQVYISIADVPYTRDYVPGSVIGQDTEYCWKPDLTVMKGAKVYIKVANSTGAAIDCDVVFEYEY